MRNIGASDQILRRSGRAGLRLRPTGFAAMAVVATELAVMFFGATLPTPLYPLYRAGVRLWSNNPDADLRRIRARQPRGAAFLRAAIGPDRTAASDLAGDRCRCREHAHIL